MTKTLIENIDYVVTVDEAGSILRNVSILIVDGSITAIGTSAELAQQAEGAIKVDGRRKLLLPGLINLHTHLPMALLRGLSEDVDLQGFLKRVWAAEGAAMDPATAELGAKLGSLESLQAGSTTQLDMYFHHVDTHRGALAVGTRHVGGPTFFDFPGPDNHTWEQRLGFLESWPADLAALGGPQIPTSISPHGTYTVSQQHLTDLISVMKTWNNPLLTIHISENEPENIDVQTRFGKSPTQLLADAGGLTGEFPVVFGHGVWLSPEDRKLVKNAGAAVAHCPGSNLKLASGALNWMQWKADGVRVGVGTDGCSSSNDLDMWQAMRLAGLLARLTTGRADVTPAIDIIRGATIEGARALGMGDVIGSVEIGKRADLTLIDLDKAHLTPVHDVHALVVFAAGRGDVCDVFVDGEHVLRDGHSTRIDEAELLAKANERGAVAAAAADAS
jgi:5-methylthioadenosine/S-adenosylhomocysteine deaminase